ncbi:MAG: hypothetical protein K0R73_456 [Candidatus Midichloriaceae bacterium]|jgi:hypothetical protein|nr:hypothetical protein [Candidatus Midichloriaceae bacterium]
MNTITKLNLKELNNLGTPQDSVIHPVENIAKADEQDNLEVIPAIDTEVEKPTNPKEEEAHKLEVELAKLEVEKLMLEQNTLTQNTLTEIKVLLADIERQQQVRFTEFSKNVLLFVKNLSDKIFQSSIFGKTIADTMISHINDIIQKVKHSSSLNIKIPKSMSESVKASLLEAVKSTASKLNIEIIEHEEEGKNVSVEWDDGKADLEIDKPLKAIEEELHKFDSKS